MGALPFPLDNERDHGNRSRDGPRETACLLLFCSGVPRTLLAKGEVVGSVGTTPIYTRLRASGRAPHVFAEWKRKSHKEGGGGGARAVVVRHVLRMQIAADDRQEGSPSPFPLWREQDGKEPGERGDEEVGKAEDSLPKRIKEEETTRRLSHARKERNRREEIGKES